MGFNNKRRDKQEFDRVAAILINEIEHFIHERSSFYKRFQQVKSNFLVKGTVSDHEFGLLNKMLDILTYQ